MNYNEAIIFIDKSKLKALHYQSNVNVISQKQAYILADMLCKSNTCLNCTYLEKTLKSVDKCTVLNIDIEPKKLNSFSCSEHSEIK